MPRYTFTASNVNGVCDSRQFIRENHRDAIDRFYELTSCAVILDNANYARLTFAGRKGIATHLKDINLDPSDFR